MTPPGGRIDLLRPILRVAGDPLLETFIVDLALHRIAEHPVRLTAMLVKLGVSLALLG
jgi:hypothetical protein